MSKPIDEITIWVAEFQQIPVKKLRSFDIDRDGNEIRLLDRREPHRSGSNDKRQNQSPVAIRPHS